MKTEEATCKVAPSPTQISYPLYNVKDGVIEDSPHTAVTCSPFSIESPQAQKLYITPRDEKTKDYRLCWIVWQVAKNKSLTPMAVRLLIVLVLECWQSKDNKMIVSDDELAEMCITSPKVIREAMNLLIAEKLIERLVRGSALKGRPRICSEYALGAVFDAVPVMMRGKDKGKPYPKSLRGYCTTPLYKGTTGALQLPKRGERATPSPICTLNTHTEGSPSAFNKENWLKECLRLNPSRDLKDIERTFPLALRKGAKDGDWMHLVEYFDSFYTPRSTPAVRSPAPAPRSWQKQPSKPRDSSCESPKFEPIDYDKNLKVFEDDLYTALKNGYTTAVILASVKDPALRESGLAKAEARIEASKSVEQSLKFVMASTTTHPKPSKEAWIKECVRLGIEESKSSDSYEQLNRAGWLMSDGSVIKNWKQYANGIGKGEARRKAKAS